MPTRETFERHLKELQDHVLVLGSMVEEAIRASLTALKNRDLEAAQKIYYNDRLINEKRFHIETDCLVLIATQQPMARDLRILAAILEINTELERIGDYAKGISRINIMMGNTQQLVLPIAELEEMANLGLNMLHRALGAFIARDAAAARAIPNEDNRVDQLYNHIYHQCLNEMIANPQVIDQANYLIWAAHNLERMADRVTNICERIVFVVTGEMKELDVSDDELILRSMG